MTCTSPSGTRKQVPLSRSSSGRSLRTDFTPDTVGQCPVTISQYTQTPLYSQSSLTLQANAPDTVSECPLTPLVSAH